MSTSSVGLTGTTASNGSTLFNGTSRFSSDFQNVITRDVAIASLPIQQLQSETSNLQSQSSELTTIGSLFAGVQASIQQLETATSSGTLAATSSDTTVAQPSISTGAQAGTYTLSVTSLGSFANTLSQAGSPPVTDPSTQNVSSSSSFTLTVDGTPTTITPSANTLDGLVSAINSNSALNVQASIVNLGSSSSPDYRLTVQSTQLSNDTIQLNDGTNDLLSPIGPAGSAVTYEVDGVGTSISGNSRTITLAPGVTVNLAGQSASGSSTTITVSPNTNSIQSALTGFVNAFNSVADELNKNVGQVGGALQGNSLVYELTNTLQSLGNYAGGSGNISSLASLGITFDKTGHLSLDPTAFSSATANQIQGLTKFLGDTSSGGFLLFAQNQLTAVLDTTTGLIPNATSSLQNQVTTDNNLITTDQARVAALQTSLQAQLSASDALVATLEQSYSLVAGLFQAQQNNVTAASLG
jgi:flagellar hook-associated protein 2